jgi:hypothetical protein
LDLLKSRRQRGVMPPGLSEFSIHVAIADLLRRWALPGWEWTHLPFGELRSPATAGWLARMGVKRGYADFAFFHADGRVAFMEVKREGGKLSPDQQRIADHMRKAGHRFEVVDSIEAAISTLVVWGVVRRMTVQ